jgi:hypothetical protein
MNDAPLLRQLAQQMITQQVGGSGDSAQWSSAAVQVYRHIITSLSHFLGKTGTYALFRRSVQLTEGSLPPLRAVRGVEQEGMLDAVEACFRDQEPDEIRRVSIALLVTFLEVLAKLVGEPLTQQLIQEAGQGLTKIPPGESSE